MYRLTFLFFFLCSFQTLADYSQDIGEVSQVFVNPQGAIAIKLKNGFPNAVQTKQCEGNNGWAGLSESDAVLKSVIIVAKSSGQILTVTIDGCNGGWFKIRDLYLN
ncbi:hypothetical protein LZP73_16390 [Shewanella sp. AS16]|uniref:hypothetical protein n=1 Tax=Shewanella sp. AS16 TaxID=2907625 RepID=UPI001F468EFD|nr:hypothetical protein [Shewanella sp. AS16]MCE9687760.1 hypothetical protein [Shewanella sp. AS16]